jgi:uncharacterized protein YjaG (DUF416 family)
VAIHLPFIKLNHWQQIAFSAALLERMLPNYKMFSEAADFGEPKLLRNQLDLIWQWLAGSDIAKGSSIKINVEAQLNKLEPETPDPEKYDFFGVFPALDACMALTALWQLMQSKPAKKGQDIDIEDIQSISRLSYSSVYAYIELELSQELPESEVTEQAIVEHPLMQWEKEVQNELFDLLKFAAKNQRTCQLIKKIVLSEGLSNLGIEMV